MFTFFVHNLFLLDWISQFMTSSRFSVKSYLTGSGPVVSKSNSKSLSSLAIPRTTSVKPNRVPRHPRAPAPNGSHENVDGAPPLALSSSQRCGSNCSLPLREFSHALGSLPRNQGEKQNVSPTLISYLPSHREPSFVAVLPTNGTGGYNRRISLDTATITGMVDRMSCNATPLPALVSIDSCRAISSHLEFCGSCKTYIAAVIVEAVVSLPAITTSNKMDRISLSSRSDCSTKIPRRSARFFFPSSIRRDAITSATSSRSVGSRTSVTRT
mmetsp:Transcript_23271/g.27512  ORF Transcript_23271/g.27512 Transcript_23271/m.27512 type:complete len:270 (-) Transcript_23271:501-1310(-)